MGQYFDYFRTRDAKEAKAIADVGYIGEAKGVDFLSFKGMDAYVRIGMLLAAAQGVEWGLDIVKTTSVWPPEPAPRSPEDFDHLPDDSPWLDYEYQLDEFASEFRDALAALTEAHFQRLETDWIPGEDFEYYDLDGVRSDFRSLVELARRAQSAGDKLFVKNPVS